MFVLAFVLNIVSFFQMESLKVVERFDGGNFHLWKFKMHIMLSKHGLWKFVDGSAIILNDEVEMVDCNKKATNKFTLLCEHLMDAQLAHIQYSENVKSVWETLCGVHEARTITNKLFIQRSFFTVKMQEGEDLLAHVNMVKALANQLRSIEMKIEDKYVYMVLFMNLPPSFDNLVMNLESMSTKDVDLQFITFNCFMKFLREKKVKVQKVPHYLIKLIR